jgi:HAD superfamily hydrolase (TIGR01484 family)
MRPISEMTKEDIRDVKLIVFDVDGVLVPRGTKISQDGDMTSFNIKKIPSNLIDMIKELNRRFAVNISSGRGLYMLQDMFREILPYVSLTYENGSATWDQGQIIQHVNSFSTLNRLHSTLPKIRHPNIKGFEPKEHIITIHCTDRVPEIEKAVNEIVNDGTVYVIWNGEAYDIGLKDKQTKGAGLKSLAKSLGIEKKNILAIGDNYNDIELLESAGIKVTADKSRLDGDFFIPLEGKFLPAQVLIEKLLDLSSKSSQH